MSLLDDALAEAVRARQARDPEVDIRKALELIAKQLRAPLADTWGCSHPGHLVTMIERLGMVSTEVQQVAEAHANGMPGAERNYREDLVKQLAELGANVVTMIVEEIHAIRKLG